MPKDRTNEPKPTWEAGNTLLSAMEYAIELHADHARKMNNEPYLGHLLGVASNVIEGGGSEVQAAAALLHDAIEDRDATEELIAGRVGADVARLVSDCTEKDDGTQNRSGSWWSRKLEYLEKLGTGAHEPSLLVALADKVNNCEKTARDFRRHVDHGGTVESFWEPFNAGDSCQYAWYTGLVRAFKASFLAEDPLASPLVQRLEDAVESLFSHREISTCTKEHGHAEGHGVR